jgi:hypothetical protein
MFKKRNEKKKHVKIIFLDKNIWSLFFLFRRPVTHNGIKPGRFRGRKKSLKIETS